jgi:hypothetical protein
MLTINGILPRVDVNGASFALWLSDRTRHGLIQSNGSISVASFTSAFGLGVAGLPTANFIWQYATTYYAGDADDIVLVAAPGILSSANTLTITYLAGSNLRTSYLTSAPKSTCVGTFDNYIVAWNVTESDTYATRVQWCQRGNPSNWTGEGAGFEDLLEMKGVGNRVIGTQDNRLVLFSTLEIWYGLPATYPAQFQFYPLDRGVGCIAPHTITETDMGLVFLGSDLNLRVLPRGGGPSQILAPQMREAIQQSFAVRGSVANNLSLGVYDPIQRLYYLWLDPTLDGTRVPFVLNMDSGEWGRLTHATTNVAPRVGCAFTAPFNSAIASTLFFGNSKGTVFSDNSAVAGEDGSTGVSAVWQSPPIAADLHGCYKTLTNVNVDYRSYSTATLLVSTATNGSSVNALDGSTSLALPRAPMHGRAEHQLYVGGPTPAVRLTSTSTGFEIHRLDVQMVIGGRP